MVVSPADLPVTLPLLSTVATEESEEVQKLVTDGL